MKLKLILFLSIYNIYSMENENQEEIFQVYEKNQQLLNNIFIEINKKALSLMSGELKKNFEIEVKELGFKNDFENIRFMNSFINFIKNLLENILNINIYIKSVDYLNIKELKYFKDTNKTFQNYCNNIFDVSSIFIKFFISKGMFSHNFTLNDFFKNKHNTDYETYILNNNNSNYLKEFKEFISLVDTYTDVLSTITEKKIISIIINKKFEFFCENKTKYEFNNILKNK